MLGPPRDAAEWLVLAAALVALIVAIGYAKPTRRVLLERPRLTLLGLAVLALLGSAGYIVHYLRGGPRIIDATSYWLEARALAHGYLAFPVPEPTGSFRGRFLLSAPGAETLAVLFPPGYPALLALGFLAGAPLAVGPLLAAGLTIVTFGLARRLFGRDDVALTAAAISTLCAALRYHTADTMSHGLAALLLAAALWAALTGGRAIWLAGLALGWLLATRPVSGLVGVVLVSLFVMRQRPASLAAFAVALIPGLALLALHQHAATGSWLGSTQLRYYALSDGPPGCFRYGFGAGIGCMFEHGDFVKAHLREGYGLGAALGTTGRRLWLHALDIGNAWPMALLVPWALFVGRREPTVRVLGFGIVALVVAYSPFYFDGNYPGGGARLFAEALPLEHVLVAWALCRLRVARFAPAFMLGAFAVYSAKDHRALAERELGRPLFDAAVLKRAGVERGLVFISSDHGFNLAHRPGELDPRTGLVVARWRDDAHDRLLWDRLGRPPAFRFLHDPRPALEPFVPPEKTRFDGGALWPPTEVAEGWAHPDWPSAACAEGRYALRLRGGTGTARVTVRGAVPRPGRYRLVPHWAVLAGGPVEVLARVGEQRWQASWAGDSGTCRDTPGPVLLLAETDFDIELGSRGDGLSLAWLEALPERDSKPEPKRR